MSDEKPTVFQLVADWENAKSCLASAKLIESKARDVLIKELFPTVHEGVQNYDLADGRVVKVTGRKSYKLADDEKVQAALKKIAESDAEGEFIGKRLVKTKIELAIGEFKKLSPKLKKIFEKVITTTPGTPEIEIVKPKSI